MTNLSQQVASSVSPYVWSLVLAFATVLISIALLYLARFSANLEVKDLADLRSMFDRSLPGGSVFFGHSRTVLKLSASMPAALLAGVAALYGRRRFLRLRLSQPLLVQHFGLPISAPMCSTCLHDPFPGCWVSYAVAFSTGWD